MSELSGITVNLSDESLEKLAFKVFKLIKDQKIEEVQKKVDEKPITQAELCRDHLDCSPATFNKYYRATFPFHMKGTQRVYYASEAAEWKQRNKQYLDEHSA